MNALSLPLLLPALALSAALTGCAPNGGRGNRGDRTRIDTPSENSVQPDLHPVVPGLAQPQSAAPKPRDAADFAIAAALSITPPVVAYDRGPEPDLSREGRRPVAYSGYVDETDSALFVYTVDRFGGNGALNSFGGGAYNRYERRATSLTTRTRVR